MNSELLINLQKLGEEKKTRIIALEKCDNFISSATDQAAYGDSYSFFGRMRETGEALPSIFEDIDKETFLKGVDRRVRPYLRSQLFIALISELEDFISQVLYFVLSSYPKKIDDMQINLVDIIELKEIDSIIDYAISIELNRLFYSSPKEYRKKIEEILSMDHTLLDPIWLSYIEMKARRDLGVHNQWKLNNVYKSKVLNAGGTIPTSKYLLINKEYFSTSLNNSHTLLNILLLHCENKFGEK
ncbi:MAG: hypothetical protein GYA51_10080 [Candidatus Methanofastidiosa archaeon]|nr:hypothetical protein [Candidatus Methanofastidiosa archaeon]